MQEMIIFLLCMYASVHAGWAEDIKKHDEYWKQHGKKSLFDDQRYDGDIGRRTWLIEGLRKENPILAQRLAQEGLPDPVCYDLEEHIDYWRKNGNVDGVLYDKDWNKRDSLLSECEAKSSRRAQELKKYLLPSYALIEFEEHVKYWEKRAHIDLDPVRFYMLYEGAKKIDPVKADRLALQSPWFVLEEFGKGKVPSFFRLKGKISDPVRNGINQLITGVDTLRLVPDMFFKMYYELSLKKWDLNQAIITLENGKKLLSTVKQTVENNILIRGTDLKKDLMVGFEAFEKVLPELNRVLKNLYGAIDDLDPSVSPQKYENENVFAQVIKKTINNKVEREVGTKVGAVMQTLEHRGSVNGPTLIQALRVFPDFLADKNL